MSIFDDPLLHRGNLASDGLFLGLELRRDSRMEGDRSHPCKGRCTLVDTPKLKCK